MAKIVYRLMPASRELPQQSRSPGQKPGCKNPRVGANFWYKSAGGGGYGKNSCITLVRNVAFMKSMSPTAVIDTLRKIKNFVFGHPESLTHQTDEKAEFHS